MTHCSCANVANPHDRCRLCRHFACGSPVGDESAESVEQPYIARSDGQNITCTATMNRGNDVVSMAGIFVGPIRDGLGGTMTLSSVSGATASALGSDVNANGVPTTTLAYRKNRTSSRSASAPYARAERWISTGAQAPTSARQRATFLVPTLARTPG